MDFVFVTGKLGQGKTLASIAKIKERIERGCPVATNCDLFLEKMFHKKTDKPRVIRIPDKPTLGDLEIIGRGRPKEWGYQEDKNGLLVLDECGDWFNSRNWQDKTRAGVNTWFRHARKLGWDVFLIVQDISIIDNQARESLAASIARCKRMDKVAIPFLTSFAKVFLGINFRPAKFHMARIEDADGVFLDRWIYKGAGLYQAYDTEQIFMHEYPHGVHSLLTPWHIYGRHMVTMNWGNIMRLTKIYWRQFSRPAVAVLTAAVTSACSVIGTYAALKPDPAPEPVVAAAPEPQAITLSERYAGWAYNGSMAIGDRVTFYFYDADGYRVDSHSTRLSGVTFRETGFCQVELVKGADVQPLKCPPESA